MENQMSQNDDNQIYNDRLMQINDFIFEKLKEFATENEWATPWYAALALIGTIASLVGKTEEEQAILMRHIDNVLCHFLETERGLSVFEESGLSIFEHGENNE